MRCVSLLIPAAGASVRMELPPGSLRKPFMMLAGQPMIVRTLHAFRRLPTIGEIILAVHPDDLATIRSRFRRRLEGLGVSKIVAGGVRRQDTVLNALRASNSRYGFAAVHDAVRPLVSRPEIEAVFAAAFQCGAAILATPVVDTLRKSRDPAPSLANRKTPYNRSNRKLSYLISAGTVARDRLWRAQTPQVFRKSILAEALRAANARGVTVSDDAQAVELLGREVKIVAGSPLNMKITTPEDLLVAEALIKARFSCRKRSFSMFQGSVPPRTPNRKASFVNSPDYAVS